MDMNNADQQGQQEDSLRETGLKKKTGKKKRFPLSPDTSKRDITITAGQLIVLKRKELGWSQEQLAWNCSMSRVQMGRIERDECDPGIKTIEELESVLGIELYDLFMARKREKVKMGMRKQRDMHASSDLFE